MEFDLSAPAPAQEPAVDLSRAPQERYGFSEENIAERTFKFHSAMGDASPGYDKVQSILSSPEGEKTLRSTIAIAERAKNVEAAKAIFKERNDLSSQSYLNIGDAANTDVAHDAIMEKRYSHDVLSASILSGEQEDNVTAETEDPKIVDEAYLFYHNEMAKNEVLRTLQIRAKEDLKSESWFTFAGNLATSAIPGLSWANELDATNRVTGAGLGPELESLLPENRREELYKKLNSLPADEYAKHVNAIYDELKKGNNHFASNWVRGLSDYGTNSKGYNIAGEVFNAATLVSPAKVVKAFKGVKVVEKGLDGTEIAVNPALTPAVLQKVTKAEKVAPVVEKLKRVKEAVAQKAAGPAEVLSAVGKVEEAAAHEAPKLLGAVSNSFARSKAEELAAIHAKIPSSFNPEVFPVSASTAFKPRALRLAALMKENTKLFLKAETDVINVARLPEEAQNVGLQIAHSELEAEVKAGGNYSVLAVNHVKAEDSAVNAAFTEAKIGNKNGTFFKSAKVADTAAQTRFNLAAGTYSISQEGEGYAIILRKYVKETGKEVRDALLKNSKSNLNKNTVLGVVPLPKFIRGAKDNFSEFQNAQRASLVHAVQAKELMYRRMFDASKTLPKDEAQAVERMMKINRDTFTTPGDPETRGMFYNNTEELAAAYSLHEGRLPTEKEVALYATFRQQSDMQHTLTSVNMLRDATRVGAEKVVIKSVEGTPVSFHGVSVSDVPNVSSNPGGVMLWDGKKAEYLRLNQEGLNSKWAALKERGYRVFQTYNPEDGGINKAFGVNGHINFVVIKDFKKGPLQASEMLNYRPGFHVKYNEGPSTRFVKQAKISFDLSIKKNVYNGDTVFVGSQNGAKALKEGKLIEEVRLALKKKDDVAAQAALNKGLPYSLKDIKVMFKTRFNLDTPFSITGKGENAGSTLVKTVNGKTLYDEVGHFEDYSSSPYNLSKNSSNAWSQAKDGPLKAIDEEAQSIVDADTMSPFDTQTSAMAELIRSKHFTDYKIGSAEAFTKEFGHLLTVNKNSISPQELMRNPIWHLQHGKIEGFSKEAVTARQIQSNIQALTSHSSHLQDGLDRFHAGTVSAIYSARGMKYTELADKVLSSALSDPLQRLRAMAYHKSMGFFNIAQVFKQASASVTPIAVSPKHGLNAALASGVMRKLDLLPTDDAVHRMVSGYVQKLTPGWTAEMFSDSFKTLKKTGFDLSGTGSAIRDDLSDPSIFTSKVGHALELGTTFFRGADRYARMVAWNTAYSEYVSKFPKLIGRLEKGDIDTILNRATDLNINMGREGKASWQLGSFNIGSQFLGYNARMHDLFTGIRLTPSEKTRLFAAHATLYGLPTAATPFLLFAPMRDMIKEGMMVHGINPDEGEVDAATNGLLSVSLEALTGRQYETSSYGPGSIDTFYKLFLDKKGQTGFDDIIDTLSGPGGSLFKNIASQTWELGKDVQFFFSNDAPVDELEGDVKLLLQNITTINNVNKLWMAYNYGKYIQNKPGGDGSANRVTLENYTMTDAVVANILGIDPQDISSSYLKIRADKEIEAHEQEISVEIKNHLRKYLLEKDKGNEDIAQSYLKKAKTLSVMGDFDEVKQAKLLKAVMKETPLNKVLEK